MKRHDVRGLHGMTRRDLLKGSALGALGLALGLKPLQSLGAEPVLFSAAQPASTVVLIRQEAVIDANGVVNPDIVAAMIDTGVTMLSGQQDVRQAWGQYVRPDDIVGMKFTQCQWMRIPTDPAVIDAVKRRVLEVGIPEAKLHAYDGGLPVKECTALINLPSVKIHSLTGIAAALKNYINFTNSPSAYHHGHSDKLGEIWMRPDIKGKTRLIITDILRPYFGPGPQINPLHRWNYNGILVGTDPVAMDTVCLAICQAKRTLFKGEFWPITPPPKSVAAADTQYGLGTSDPLKIKLIRSGWEQESLI